MGTTDIIDCVQYRLFVEGVELLHDEFSVGCFLDVGRDAVDR